MSPGHSSESEGCVSRSIDCVSQSLPSWVVMCVRLCVGVCVCVCVGVCVTSYVSSTCCTYPLLPLSGHLEGFFVGHLSLEQRDKVPDAGVRRTLSVGERERERERE